MVLIWGWGEWASLRQWWRTERARPRDAPRAASRARRWRDPMLVGATGLGLPCLLTLSARWPDWAPGEVVVVGVVVVPLVAYEFWEVWREGRASAAAYRAAVRERHQRALAAGVGVAVPSRLRRLDSGLAYPACAQMHALWDVSRALSVDQAGAIRRAPDRAGDLPAALLVAG